MNKDVRDIVGGLLLVLIGIFAAVYAQRYDFGTLTRMGPGFFPVVLGTALAVLGLFIAVPAFFRRGDQFSIEIRPLGFVIFSLICFALLLNILGLVVTAFVSAFVSALAVSNTWAQRLWIALGVAVLTYLIFIYGLSMVMPVWPWSN